MSGIATRAELALAAIVTSVAVLAALALNGHDPFPAAVVLFAMVLGFLNIARQRDLRARGIETRFAQARDWLSVMWFGFAALMLAFAKSL